MGERGRQTKPDLVPLLGIALPRVTKIKESSNLCEDTNMGVVRRCGILYRHHILTSTTIPPHPQHRVSWYHHHWYSTPLLHRDSQSWTRLMCMESFSFRQRFPCGWPPLLLFIGYATICEYWVGSNAPPLTLFIHSRSQWVVTCLHGCYWSL